MKNICIYREGAVRHIGNPRVRWMVCKKCAKGIERNFAYHEANDILSALQILHKYAWGINELPTTQTTRTTRTRATA